MKSADSVFLKIEQSKWICSNELAFAIFDNYPVSKGHALVITRRVVPTWFECTGEEQAALMDLVNETKQILDEKLEPKPDGYNIGFNAGEAAGQTVPHVHIHVIPRYLGDMQDPRGGVRHVIPEKGNYLAPATTKTIDKSASAERDIQLTTGYPDKPLWPMLSDQLVGALEIDLVAAFAQRSGLDLIQRTIFRAVQAGSRIRILVSDYLGITDPDALEQLIGWVACTGDMDSNRAIGRLEARLLEFEKIHGGPASFHPKSWRISDANEGILVVGSSNISRAGLLSGIEWNLVGRSKPDNTVLNQAISSFEALWKQASALDLAVIEGYRERSKKSAALRAIWDGEFSEENIQEAVSARGFETGTELPNPRPWQIEALKSLARIREQKFNKALVAVATGLGKTWLAAFDVIELGKVLGRCPKVLVVAHRAEILAQAESTLRTALQLASSKFGWNHPTTSWFAGDGDKMAGDIVVASIQKLARQTKGISENLDRLESLAFDYCVIDEVHHAQAPSYRRLLARLQSRFTLGLTATPERTDGIDVATLFDDILAAQATIGDGIGEGSLVPFRYRGLKDDVDFEQIPWRNGKFDLTVLEERLENSKRMERLWTEWLATDGKKKGKTVVFCVSKRHALFARNWLRRKGVSCAAIFSQGEVTGADGRQEKSDSRIESIQRFSKGELSALCVVDLFNEGVDIPLIDRVVMLRPTESKVVFLQQLGRGLRAAEGKTRLTIIDFVGNHKVFANRLTHILSLNETNYLGEGRWKRFSDFVRGGEPKLPPGCLLDVDIDAIELMRRFVPTGKAAAVEAYRTLRMELERRPTPSEVFQAGYLPMAVSADHGTWFGFCNAEKDLANTEEECLEAFGNWFEMLQTTNLTKSYKMVVLRVLLDQQQFWNGMTIRTLSEKCHHYLKNHPILRKDLEGAGFKSDGVSDEDEAFRVWWLKWPLSRWADRQNGQIWFKMNGEFFQPNFQCEEKFREVFEGMSGEIIDYRLAQYLRNRLINRKNEGVDGTEVSFFAKVSHSAGRAILFLPTVESVPGRPVGPTEIRLPDGRCWVFKFVKVACNVAYPKDGQTVGKNQLPELLQQWFGEKAGHPGTNFQVEIRQEPTGEGLIWVARPLGSLDTSVPKAIQPKEEINSTSGGFPFQFNATCQEADKYSTHVPVFHLSVAAGAWGPETNPEEIGWADLSGRKLEPGMFVAQVFGHSMEPTIPDRAWCLFKKPAAGTRQNKIVLVQFNSLGDPETGGRFTVKRYRSEKGVTEEGWEHRAICLVPLNPEYAPIEISGDLAREVLVVGEWVAVLGGG